MNLARLQRIRGVLDRRQPDLTVLLDNVHKPHNFSAIMRSSDAIGVAGVHAVWPDPTMRPRRHTSGGTSKWITICTHPSLEDGMEYLHRRGLRIYAAHLSPRAKDFRKVDYTIPTAILLGAERDGVSEHGLALADEHIIIGMHGMVPSLNVSVAAAVILYEAERQRQQAGMYDRCRLDHDSYQRTLFEWLHPSVADHCRRHKMDYPAMDDHGDVTDFEPVVQITECR